MNMFKNDIVVGYVLTVLVMSTFAIGQQSSEKYTIQGVVKDKTTQQVLVGANVILRKAQKGSVTDADGYFRIDPIAAGVDTLAFIYVGFADTFLVLSINKSMNLEVEMTPKAVEANEVNIVEYFDVEKNSSQYVTSISEEEILHLRGQTISEALLNVPGVTLMQTGPSITKPVIRGLHSQRVLVLNAGVPQEGQQWGAEHAPEIDPFAPAKIEVLRGAAAVQYGSGAMGGVVRIQPRELPQHFGMSGNAQLNLFSNSQQGATALMAEGMSDKLPGISWRLQGSTRKAGDSQTPDFNMRNTGFSELNYSASVGLARQNFHTDIHFSHFGTELGIYKWSHIGNLSDLQRAIDLGEPFVIEPFSYDVGTPKQQIAHNLFSLHSVKTFPSLGELEVQYGWQNNRRKEFDAHGNNLGKPAFDMSLTTYSGDVSFKHNPIGNWFGKIGVNGIRQGNVRKTTGFLIPNFRMYGFGAYLLEKWSKSNFTFEIGLRYDYQWRKTFLENRSAVIEALKTYQNLSGAIGVILSLQNDWSVSANLSSGWRAPSVNELYSDGIHHGTAQYEIGNKNLLTEENISADLTLRHFGEKMEFQASIFNNYFQNFIFLLPDAEPTLTIRGAFPTFRFDQAKSTIRGVDAEVHYHLSELVELGGSASVIYAQNLESDEPLFNMPANRFGVSQELHTHQLGFLLHPSLRFSTNIVLKQNRVPDNVDYAPAPDGYTLFNIDFSTKLAIAKTEVDFGISIYNLFDTAYRDYLSRFRYFIDNPGRNIVLRLNVPFGKTNN